MLNETGDLFEMTSLTAALNSSTFIPGAAGELFTDVDGMNTTTAVVDVREGQITLIDDTARGAAAQANDGDGTGAPVALLAKHFPVEEIIKPSDFQNIRQLGDADSLETLEAVRDRKLEIMRKKHALTLEHQRVQALQGKLTNSAGGAVDLFAAFGGTQIEVAMNLDNDATRVRSVLLDAIEASEDEVGDISIDGFVKLCGKNYWRNFVEHKSVVEAYQRYQDGAALREDMRSGFMLDDVKAVRYRGTVGGVPLIADDEAYLVPIADLYCTRFAPGDFVETANTMGLPMYGKARELDYNKGIGIWTESNPISFIKKPSAVIKLHRAGIPAG
ncbi:major capsid protein [Sulfitobacter sp. M22]|uniref:major capsid protein n=1 Tax=Sulfitobacter sp. M22 TaxID=2675332 RepID=UPI001F3B83FB|nr:major capsid protein [Sulfitobacter sp. M22]MCF7728662.1 hypothetical protein [Sulfitobacter sp. M22]